MSHLHKLVGFNVLWAHVHGNMGCKVASNREQRDYLYILWLIICLELSVILEYKKIILLQ